MKFFTVLILGYSAWMSPLHAIPSALNQSITTMQTILSSPLFSHSVSQNEAVVELAYKGTKTTSSGRLLIYEIKTEVGGVVQQQFSGFVEKIKHQHNYYKVELTVQPNPMIGPPLIEVTKVKQISSQAHFD